ncbi:hypothetical protein X798_01825 [Onchocerca flexuosa]|uniref:Uncharacterized protein n=2 Tax=Onchocerca flexuosa TaxID=387005 RepID=A0A183GZH5_9BILA|nr:hypothetical protein X798_01825 [Onchocerca flexuosa]VDO26493.1 unnamed protein product [Onchocerca flexuosa]
MTNHLERIVDKGKRKGRGVRCKVLEGEKEKEKEDGKETVELERSCQPVVTPFSEILMSCVFAQNSVVDVLKRHDRSVAPCRS